jgi:hypothetical protein
VDTQKQELFSKNEQKGGAFHLLDSPGVGNKPEMTEAMDRF